MSPIRKTLLASSAFALAAPFLIVGAHAQPTEDEIIADELNRQQLEALRAQTDPAYEGEGDIDYGVNDLADDAGEALDDAGEWVEDAAEDAGEWIDDAADDVGDAVEDAVDAAEDAVEDAGEEVEDALDDQDEEDPIDPSM